MMTTAVAIDSPPLIGDIPFAVVAWVPHEIQQAITIWALRRAWDLSAWARYQDARDALEARVMGKERVDMSSLDPLMDECRARNDELLESRERLERLIPCRMGWYPHGGEVWGWAKRSSFGGLELVHEPSSWDLDGERARRERRRYYEGLARRGVGHRHD
jgi:hypothetical protein